MYLYVAKPGSSTHRFSNYLEVAHDICECIFQVIYSQRKSFLTYILRKSAL